MTVRAVLMRRRKWERTDVFCVLFSTVMLFLITAWIALSALYGQETWDTERLSRWCRFILCIE
ncbi:hypothetical protein J3R82DRAFT_2145 [Butyriboletus roseoflavus]|nr:hypothetical protein J3R82DRAFT_2145 [Butyriboletus roseoflavus]